MIPWQYIQNTCMMRTDASPHLFLKITGMTFSSLIYNPMSLITEGNVGLTSTAFVLLSDELMPRELSGAKIWLLHPVGHFQVTLFGYNSDFSGAFFFLEHGNITFFLVVVFHTEHPEVMHIQHVFALEIYTDSQYHTLQMLNDPSFFCNFVIKYVFWSQAMTLWWSLPQRGEGIWFP